MICSDVKTSTTPSPECSSYADVTRGSAALSTAANTIQTSTPQAFSDKPKMLFENFVELGKFGNFHSQGIPDSMTDMSNARNGFHRGNQYPLKDQMYPNVKTFTPPKTDYEFVKGFGDVALNPHLLQANNSFHKAGSNHFQPYTNRPNLNDISKLQTRYQSELSQLYGTNLSGINGNPRGPVPSDSPYNNINHLTNHVGYTGATNNPWYKQNEIHSINALLYQASGITGLPPVPPKRLPNALPSAKIHDGVITSEVEMCKEQVGITLQGSLNGCYNELQNLEGERKKVNFLIVLFFICSSLLQTLFVLCIILISLYNLISVVNHIYHLPEFTLSTYSGVSWQLIVLFLWKDLMTLLGADHSWVCFVFSTRQT